MKRLLTMAPKGLVRNGLVAEYKFDQRNLLKYSEDFSNVQYVKSYATLTPNATISPDGTVTASKLVEDTSSSIHRLQFSIISQVGQMCTLSFFVKRAERRYVNINANTFLGARTTFDLDTGQIATLSGAASIVQLSNGWWRCSVTGTVTIASSTVFVQVNNVLGTGLDATYLGDGVSGIYVWGAMFNIGAEPLPYQKTTDNQTLTDYSVPNINLIPSGKETFEGWTAYSGTTATITQNQTVSEWNTDKATRMQTSGGTSLAKYFYSYGYGITGSAYAASVKIKNIGTVTVKATSNQLSTGTINIAPGETKTMICTGVANGVGDIQIHFQALNIADSLDFIAYQPMVSLGSPQSYIRPRYNGQLGSTTGADTNDPTPTGQGLSFLTDDYVKLPYMINAEQDFTIYLVLNIGGSIPVSNEWYLGFGNSGASTQYAGIYRLSSQDSIFCNIINDAGVTTAVSISTVDSGQRGIKLIKMQRKSSKLYISDVATGRKSSPGNLPEGSATFNLLTIGALIRSSIAGYVNQPEYYAVFYPRATTDAEDQQVYRYIKRELAKRGVAI